MHEPRIRIILNAYDLLEREEARVDISVDPATVPQLIESLATLWEAQKLDVNILDLAIIIVIGFALARGLRNGFLPEARGTVRLLACLELARGLRYGFLPEAGGLVGLLANLELVNSFYRAIVVSLSRNESISQWSPQIAFIFLFLVGIIMVDLLLSLLKPLLNKIVPSSLNSFAGLVLGTLKGGLFCALVVTFLQWAVPNWSILEESALKTWLIPQFAQLRSMLPWSL